jgi:hypothetical protein
VGAVIVTTPARQRATGVQSQGGNTWGGAHSHSDTPRRRGRVPLGPRCRRVGTDPHAGHRDEGTSTTPHSGTSRTV